MHAESSVVIVTLFPDLFGAYGDTGNATILSRRLEWRGIPTETVSVMSGQPAPQTGDVYVIGGGEDPLQVQAVRELDATGGLGLAIDSGAVVFAVCGGVQVLGRTFQTDDGTSHSGIGLIDAESNRIDGSRAVGEILVEPDPDLGLPLLTGFENHGGVTRPGTAARPIGRVVAGVGDGRGFEGVIDGRVIGTHMHGPVLARNPALADMVLEWVVGGPLTPIDDPLIERLRLERIEAVRNRRPRRSWRATISARGG